MIIAAANASPMGQQPQKMSICHDEVAKHESLIGLERCSLVMIRSNSPVDYNKTLTSPARLRIASSSDGPVYSGLGRSEWGLGPCLATAGVNGVWVHALPPHSLKC